MTGAEIYRAGTAVALVYDGPCVGDRVVTRTLVMQVGGQRPKLPVYAIGRAVVGSAGAGACAVAGYDLQSGSHQRLSCRWVRSLLYTYVRTVPTGRLSNFVQLPCVPSCLAAAFRSHFCASPVIRQPCDGLRSNWAYPSRHGPWGCGRGRDAMAAPWLMADWATYIHDMPYVHAWAHPGRGLCLFRSGGPIRRRCRCVPDGTLS